MKVLICGIDGYLGWPLALHLFSRGHEVFGIDNLNRRIWVQEAGSDSGIPIPTLFQRKQVLEEKFKKDLHIHVLDTRDHAIVARFIREHSIKAVVHLAEMPSAPFSMASLDKCILTHRNNVEGTLSLLWAIKEIDPQIHLLKLGTMGEYGTPGCPIPEGELSVQYEGQQLMLPFPKQPGSFYHCTKAHDTVNIALACKIWGLRCTDVMQGIVYGTSIPEMLGEPQLRTRFDFDAVFGTAINRFCAQAVVGLPITPYGKGLQTRGFLPLRDSMQCLRLALEHPPQAGQHRVFNQFAKTYTVLELARIVQRCAGELGLSAKVEPIDNPRLEQEEHRYEPVCQKLPALGYEPEGDIEQEVVGMLMDLLPYKEHLTKHSDAMTPRVSWRRT